MTNEEIEKGLQDFFNGGGTCEESWRAGAAYVMEKKDEHVCKFCAHDHYIQHWKQRCERLEGVLKKIEMHGPFLGSALDSALREALKQSAGEEK